MRDDDFYWDYILNGDITDKSRINLHFAMVMEHIHVWISNIITICIRNGFTRKSVVRKFNCHIAFALIFSARRCLLFFILFFSGFYSFPAFLSFSHFAFFFLVNFFFVSATPFCSAAALVFPASSSFSPFPWYSTSSFNCSEQFVPNTFCLKRLFLIAVQDAHIHYC